MTLHEYRTREGLSQFDMAVKAGVTPGTIANIERGNGINVSTAKAIIDATGGLVTLDDLLPKNGNEPPAAAT